jgi:hypothetical protein
MQMYKDLLTPLLQENACKTADAVTKELPLSSIKKMTGLRSSGRYVFHGDIISWCSLQFTNLFLSSVYCLG